MNETGQAMHHARSYVLARDIVLARSLPFCSLSCSPFFTPASPSCHPPTHTTLFDPSFLPPSSLLIICTCTCLYPSLPLLYQIRPVPRSHRGRQPCQLQRGESTQGPGYHRLRRGPHPLLQRRRVRRGRHGARLCHVATVRGVHPLRWTEGRIG